MTIREAMSLNFGVPIQNMTFMAYLTYLNSNGKITQRSLLDILILICEQVENQEKREAQYTQNFKDIEVILQELVSGSQIRVKGPGPKVTDSLTFKEAMPVIVATVEANNRPDTIEDDGVGTQGKVKETPEETKTFPCDQCPKSFSSRIALAGHSRRHK